MAKKKPKIRITISMDKEDFLIIKKKACETHGGNVSSYLRSRGVKNAG